jgi:peptide methionine sulfoxide reductase MsrA
VHATDNTIPVYFGVGCFWHVQHEFVNAEKTILGRTNKELSALAGYAGGKDNSKVCYHNLQRTAEYGDLGHGEVVGLKVPADKLSPFATEYFKLFDKNGDRPDKGDRGPEYRSLVGIPGGVSSPYYASISAAAEAKGIKLAEGKGKDSDTLGRNLVWVYDSDKFPFYQAEVYHQFHGKFIE